MPLSKTIERLISLRLNTEDSLIASTNKYSRADYRKDIKALDNAIKVLKTLYEVSR